MAARTEIITIEEARLACRVDGTENDLLIQPIKDSAEAYVLRYLKIPLADLKEDQLKTLKDVVQTMCLIRFRPDVDKQGNLKAHITANLLQLGINV